MKPSTFASRVPALVLAALLASACSGEPTAPSADDPALEALLAEGSDGSRAGDGRTPLLDRLLGAALTRLADEGGPAAARTAQARLGSLREAVREARALGDRDAFGAALHAYETEAARLVVRVMGPGVVRRVIGHAAERVARTRERLEAARAAGHEVDQAASLLRRAYAALSDARSSAAAGDLPAALLLAARAVDLLGG